jgi:hypothetical protein
MMNAYNCFVAIDGNKDDRIPFHSLSLAIAYLREEMEADGKTYYMGETKPTKTSHRSKNATVTAKWVRVDDETKTAVYVSRSIYMPDYYA